MANLLKVTLEVDNVGQMDKTGAKCILKGEGTITDEPIEISLTITGGDRELFKKMNINRQLSQVEMILKDSAQQSLPDGEPPEE